MGESRLEMAITAFEENGRELIDKAWWQFDCDLILQLSVHITPNTINEVWTEA